MSSDDEIDAIVCTPGTGRTHAGFAGDDSARVRVPTTVAHHYTSPSTDNRGRFRRSPTEMGRSNESWAGEEANSLQQRLSLRSCPGGKEGAPFGELPTRLEDVEFRCPMEHGLVSNWDDMELLWDNIFRHELRVDPQEYSMLVSEAVGNPDYNREKAVQLFFEGFDVPQFYLKSSSTLAIIASGRMTGVVLESGEGVTTAVSLEEGRTLKQSIEQSTAITGSAVTELMRRHLFECSPGFSGRSLWQQHQIAQSTKREKCRVVADYDKEMSSAAEASTLTSMCLPDNTSLSFHDSATFTCPELMFKPHFAGIDGKSVNEMIESSIANSAANDISELWKNIVVAGGNTMYRGFWERLGAELKTSLSPIGRNLSRTGHPLKVIAPPERKESVWIGGSILASLTTFQTMWITKQEYDEVGPSIVKTKCDDSVI